MLKKILLFTTLILLIFLSYKSVNYKFSREISDPIFEGIMGELLIKVGGNKYLTIIENEMANGEIKKINVSINTIDIPSFHNVGSKNGVITKFEDKNYFYTIHDGEDKIIIREKKY